MLKGRLFRPATPLVVLGFLCLFSFASPARANQVEIATVQYSTPNMSTTTCSPAGCNEFDGFGFFGFANTPGLFADNLTFTLLDASNNVLGVKNIGDVLIPSSGVGSGGNLFTTITTVGVIAEVNVTGTLNMNPITYNGQTLSLTSTSFSADIPPSDFGFGGTGTGGIPVPVYVTLAGTTATPEPSSLLLLGTGLLGLVPLLRRHFRRC